jgi:hypothetical protein
MNHHTWMPKALCVVAMLAGTAWVGLPALAQSSLPGTGSVVNTPPTLSALAASPVYSATSAQASGVTDVNSFNAWVTAASATALAAPIDPRSGLSMFVEYRFSVTDPDGTADIKDVQVKLLNPDGSVHDAYAAAKSLGTSSSITAEYYAEFELKFYDAPATGGSVYSIVTKAADAAIQSGNLAYVDNAALPKTFQYSELSSVSASSASIDFGNLQANTKSAGVAITLTNKGNVPIDNTLSATNFAKGSDTIAASKLWYGPSSAASGAAFPAAGSNAKRDAGFNLAASATATRTAYLAVDVPAVVPFGSYSTTITFTASKHSGTCSSDCTTVAWS